MKNSYFYQNSLANIYAKPSVKSEVTSQILYGEKFKILNRKSGWVKILTVYDNYYGYIQLTKFINKFQPSHKIYKSKTRIFKKVKKKFYASKNFLYFASKISLKNFDKKFAQFEKNKWVKIKDIKPLNYYEKNLLNHRILEEIVHLITKQLHRHLESQEFLHPSKKQNIDHLLQTPWHISQM